MCEFLLASSYLLIGDATCDQDSQHNKQGHNVNSNQLFGWNHPKCWANAQWNQKEVKYKLMSG